MTSKYISSCRSVSDANESCCARPYKTPRVSLFSVGGTSHCSALVSHLDSVVLDVLKSL